MMAGRVVCHVAERLLQGSRAFNPCTGILAASEEHDERCDSSSVGAWMTTHEWSTERAIEDSEINTSHRRETHKEWDRVGRVGAPVLRDNQQPQVVTGTRESIDQGRRDGRVGGVALPEIAMHSDPGQELRPAGCPFVQRLDRR